MDQPLYDIYFTGKLVEGIDTGTAQANFAKLFKMAPDNAAKLFNGKAQSLKRGVDKAEALKYKAALHKAGLLVAFKAHQPSPSTTNDATTPEATNTSSPKVSPRQTSTAVNATSTESTTQQADWSLAAVGSDVLKEGERQQVPERDIDTSNIKMVSAFVDLTPEPKAAPPAPDTSHISVAAVGEDLLADKPEPPPPLPLDIDAITLAPPGTELEELHADLPPLNPYISALSLAEAGTDLLEGQTNEPPPPPPKTDHISVAKD